MLEKLKIEKLKNANVLTSKQAKDVNMLNLAFIGDAVWTVLVREFFLSNTNFKNNNLHRLTTKFVRATYQSTALEILSSDLTDDEKDIVRRARNTKVNTASKNASLADYKRATSFEALIGYLYLCANFERIEMFFVKLSEDFL